MRQLLLVLTVLVAAFASDAAAQPLMNYTYLDAAYQWTAVNDDLYDDANGLDTKLSYSPIEHFALEGGYNYLSTSTNYIMDADVGQHLFSYGVAGWYSFCNDKLDLVGRVGGLSSRLNLDGPGGEESQTDNGVYAGTSLRYLVDENLEADLNVTYRNIDATSWLYSATGLYAIHKNVALKADVGIDNDSNVYLAGGVRLAI